MFNKWHYSVASVLLVMIFVTLIVLFAVSSSAGPAPDGQKVKKKLIIDHDGGADDAMAIFIAVLYEKYFDGPEVVALTTTFGNVGEDQVFNNSQRILSVADRRDVPIYRGSKVSLIQTIPTDAFFGYDGLGDNEIIEHFSPIEAQKDCAAIALIELSKKYKGDLIIVSIGPLTNIALAMRLDPLFLSRLSHIYIGAGNVYGDNYKNAEFNAAMDVEAYYIVTQSGIQEKMTVVPFSQIIDYLPLTQDWRVKELGSITTRIMKHQNDFERTSINSSTTWCLLDPAVMAIALEETSIVEEIRYSNHSVMICNADRGRNTNIYSTKEDANVALVYRVRKEAYEDFLYSVFASELRST
ncbi:pyrimidine-specific ribonucleoside hydrolase rihA like protein [Danaus plexippus plexippus]|uniref:Pyrimidine-specific ribonucleoside hydrolase rihA like protein n=1 Tax=Danaus plexippus plexippus TaxID=278856 RepID=A0A212EM36_DANPL|nr:pyrimidine-specific ribonucleoside hydrolase rihA like protein [Danaus plexippus plexippus]